MTAKTITLPNGRDMPTVGFGTWQATKEELVTALDNALAAGYRHIDTAPVYENEEVIGEVLERWINSDKIKRQDLFVVTKLPPTGHYAGGVSKWINRSLRALRLSYLDLYLIHTPFSFEEVGDDLHPKDEEGNIKIDTSTNHIAIWREMEDQVAAGKTLAIGLSNFNEKQMIKVVNHAKYPVSNLQIELHIYFQQKEIVEYCRKNKIIITAYSPLGTRGLVKMLGQDEKIPCIMDNLVIIKIAQKHKKTPAQIALKFLIQNNIIAIPKSTNIVRIHDNINLFDFELDQEDLRELKNLDRGAAARICDFNFFKGIRNHPEYPF